MKNGSGNERINCMKVPPMATASSKGALGFTLTELLIVIAIISILAAIAIPSYTKSVVKSKRRAAEACLSGFATQMERYYTTNLRYCADANADGACDSPDFTLPSLDCASLANTGKDYSYSATVTLATFTVQAAPNTAQASRDAICGTLTLNQTGAKGASGTEGASNCW